jgi:dienelactone hydrolase
MRALELVLVLACAAFSIRMAAGGRSAGWIYAMQLALAAVLVAQIVLEGWRWQILPAYAAAILVAAAPALLGQGALALFASAISGFGLLALSVGCCLVFPYLQPRTPDGSFAAGVTRIPVEIARPAADEPYELKVQPQVELWYPAESPGRWQPMAAAIEARASKGFRALPPAPAPMDVPVAQTGQKFPVVVYFDGWPEDKTQNVNLILELVSRGFAVASVTYRGIDRPLVDYSSEAAFQQSVQLDHARTRAHARDAVAILDALAVLDAREGSRFMRRLDTQHASTLGFSFGGGVAGQATRLDPRIRAGVNMDGRHYADALEHGVEKPYLFICEELIVPSQTDLESPEPSIRYEARLDRNDYARLDANQKANGGIRVTIPGMAHMNFTDVPLRSPLSRFASGGKLDARRAQDIVRTFVVEFLLRYGVTGQPPAFDAAPWPRFPEARLQTWPPPGRVSSNMLTWPGL